MSNPTRPGSSALNSSDGQSKLNGGSLHCAQCVQEAKRGQIEVIHQELLLQIWCADHKWNIATFDLKFPMPDSVCEGAYPFPNPVDAIRP